MPNSITVKTRVFEGPLDLLLDLIESHKLLINDISLASVTEEYIERVKRMEALPLDEASEFIALAATLLLIKSRSLLPTLALSEEETRDIRELEYRLAVYQIIAEGARTLREALRGPVLYEGAKPEPDPIFAPDENATPQALLSAARRLIAEFPQAAALPKVAVKTAISLEETIAKLASRISAAVRLSFREFSGNGRASRQTIVVSFLALLELVKQGIIKATQEDDDRGDIVLEKNNIEVPSYE